MRGMRLTDELCEYRVWLISPIPNTIIRQIYKKQKFLGSIPLFCHFFTLRACNQGYKLLFTTGSGSAIDLFSFAAAPYNEMIYNQAFEDMQIRFHPFRFAAQIL